MGNNKFYRWFENDRFLFLLSMVIAILLWGYVVVYVNNEHTTVIKDVPINMQYSQADYKNIGLDVIEMDVQTVNVSVTGPRSITGDLTAEDIIVYPKITGINEAGKYTLTLTAEKASSVKKFQINSMSRDYVTVRFDRLISKEFILETDISGIRIAGDYMIDKIYATPSKVTITGPEYKIANVSRIVAAIDAQETLIQSAVYPAQLKLFDETGNQLDNNLISFDNDQVDVTIPVLKEVVLPVKVEYVNVPQGFDTSNLHQALSHTQLHLAVPSQLADSLNQFVVGYIDLQSLETDKPYVFDVKLPTGYKSMDEVAQVSATISSSNLIERTVSVSEIKVINEASQSVEVLTQVISNVTVIGTKKAVESLSNGSVIAQIDASRLPVAQGQQAVEVSFIIPSTDAAYVKGVHTATIKK